MRKCLNKLKALIKLKRTILFTLITLIITISIIRHQQILSKFAEFFTINNAIAGADAIVVLSGGSSTRIPHAIKLFSKDFAPRILLTNEKKMSTRFPHLFSTNEKIAKSIIKDLKMNIPIFTVPSLKGGATSTFDEAYDLRAFSEKEEYSKLILVTDAFHTRRALYAFNKVFYNTNIKVEISAVHNEIFNESNWWTSDIGISAYILESIKLLIYLVSSNNAPFIRND